MAIAFLRPSVWLTYTYKHRLYNERLQNSLDAYNISLIFTLINSGKLNDNKRQNYSQKNLNLTPTNDEESAEKRYEIRNAFDNYGELKIFSWKVKDAEWFPSLWIQALIHYKTEKWEKENELFFPSFSCFCVAYFSLSLSLSSKWICVSDWEIRVHVSLVLSFVRRTTLYYILGVCSYLYPIYYSLYTLVSRLCSCFCAYFFDSCTCTFIEQR